MSRDGSSGPRILNNPVPYVPQILDKKPFTEKLTKKIHAQTSGPPVKVNVSKTGTSVNPSQPQQDEVVSHMYITNNSSFGGTMD